MNIFVYSTHLNYTPHIETELELMQLHLNKGDTVFRFICNGNLSICDMNQKHDLLTCLKCRDVRNCGSNLLSGKVVNLPITINQKVELSEQLNQCKTTDDLKKIYYDNFDVGLAITSTMISILRNPNFDLDSNMDIIKEYYKSTITLYLSTINYIEKHKPDRVYIFNGRFAHVRAILRACEISGTEFVIHERGCNKDHYDLFIDKLPHDKNYQIERMESAWLNDKHKLEEKEKIGSEFYITRKTGNPKDWLSFTKEQDASLLPKNFSRSKKNIVIFNSSMDEYVSISEEWNYPFFDNQEEFIEKLMDMFKDDPEYHFYLRVHPNLKGLNNSQTDRISKLSSNNLTVIPSDSKIGSYNILDHCDQVITFGSTMGIEAVYWKKPSILVSTSFYNEESVYLAKSYEQVCAYVKSDLLAKNNLGAIKYGYYHSVKGFPYKYFKADSLFRGKFKGVYVMDANSTLNTIIKKLYNIKFIGKPIAMYDALYKKYKFRLPF